MYDIGNRLSDLLASNDISQRELAKEIGVSNATISRIISGDGNVTLKTAIAIADHFCVSLDWLTGREQ